MIGKLLGKVVDTGGDIIRRAQEGQISLTEAEAELQKLGLSLEQSVIEGQVKLNLVDAQSGSRFRTWWRPFCCWGMGVLAFALVVVITIILILVMNGTWAPDPAAIEAAKAAVAPFVDLFTAILLPLVAAIGIREGGKMMGNR